MERKEILKKELIKMFEDYYDCAGRFVDYLNDEYGMSSEEEYEEQQDRSKEDNDLNIFIKMLEELAAL